MPLSKRFRALKLWFVIRNYGIKGLQAHIRKGVRLAQKFESLILSDDRFEIPAKRHLGMVVFRLKGEENDSTEKLLKKLNGSGKMHAVPANLKGKYVIRFTVTSPRTTLQDIARDWNLIQGFANEILGGDPQITNKPTRVPLKGTFSAYYFFFFYLVLMKLLIVEIKEKNPSFGTSLLLSHIGPNSHMTPKVVNGSFAALFDNTDVVQDFNKRLQHLKTDGGKDSGIHNM